MEKKCSFSIIIFFILQVYIISDYSIYYIYKKCQRFKYIVFSNKFSIFLNILDQNISHFPS